MPNIHSLIKHLNFKEAIPLATYTNAAAGNAAAVEIDIKDARNVALYVVGKTIAGGGTPLTVKLQGSDTAGGAKADLQTNNSVVLSAPGIGKAEYKSLYLKRYVKPNVTQQGANDVYGVFLVIGNYETLPYE